MGTKVTFEYGSNTVEAITYSVTESASPLTAGDSSGGTGSFSLSALKTSASDGLDYTNFAGLVSDQFPANIVGTGVTIQDDERGKFHGIVLGLSESDDARTLNITGSSFLGMLNVHNIQASPFSGTLLNAFKYYVSLAVFGLDSLVVVDPALASRTVRFPGWNGDLWEHLKQMAMTQGAEISLLGNRITLRPIRTLQVNDSSAVGRTRNVQNGSLAQRVEVYQYNNRSIGSELAYPPGGWTPEVQVLNVNAGEEAEYTLELSASLLSIETPVMDTMVTQEESHRSVYTVVANDGLPVTPAMWRDRGGLVEITINPDTTSLNVRLRGADDIPLSTGGTASSFSLALASDTSGNRYSTLRIKGAGVAFKKELISFSTGITASQTGTEVGVTVDNPFVSTFEEATRIGLRLANFYGGSVPTLTANLTRIYSQTLGSPTFGNVNGSRIYDDRSRRWYRIREATTDKGSISISADDDLLLVDAQAHYSGRTYAKVAESITGTYGQMRGGGLLG